MKFLALVLGLVVSQSALAGTTLTDAVDLKALSTIGNAPNGRYRLAVKTDGHLYLRDSVGGENQVGSGSVTAVTASPPLLSSGGTTPNITCQVASGSLDGCLSSIDWTTFNGKQPAGSYITALTGDVAATGPGSVAATIQPNAVDDTKIRLNFQGWLRGRNALNTADVNIIRNTTSDNIEFGSNLLPSATNSFAIGSSGQQLVNLHSRVLSSDDSDISLSQSVTHNAPSGVTLSGIRNNTAGNSYGMWTANSTSPASGGLYFETGNNTGGNSGPIELRTGTASGVRGQLQILDGSEGTAGWLWTSTDTVGNGHWAAAPAGGVASVTASSPLASSGGSTPNISLTGIVSAANGGAPPTTRNLYVDGGRTDSFTADGSLARPFATIGAAISQIITNADNSTHQYTINVVPGSYAETLTFNNSLLFNIIIASTTPSGQTSTQSTTVNGITSTSNNTQLATLFFSNITINGSVNLTGDVNNTNFCSNQCVFFSSQFNNSSGTITLNNVNNVSFYGGQIQGSGSVATFTNVAFAYMAGPEGFISGTTLHLVQNNAGNQPSQSSGNYMLMSGSKFYGTLTIDAGSELDVLQNYFGSTSNITNNGIIHSWSTAWGNTTSAVFNSGSTYRNRGDTVWVPHTFNGGATPTNQDYVYMFGGVFGTTAVPATNALVVVKDGHYKSTQTTAPTTTLSGNAGTGGSPACTVSNATDVAGKVSLTTGTSAWATGTQCTINFNKTYATAPKCVFTPSNAKAAANAVNQQINFPDAATGSQTINFGVADTAQNTYTWSYSCMETQ